MLPGEDLAAYGSHCKRCRSHYQPEGHEESQLVQTISDSEWRLNRLRAMENNLFALGFEEYGDTLDTPDAQIHAALVQAKALKEHAKDFALLSLYEQRIARTLQQARKDLKAAQAERAAEQAEQASRKEAALQEAAMIHNLQKAKQQAWQPADSGFEFSSEELKAWMRRRQLEKEAETFFYTGNLPCQEEEQEVDDDE